MTQTANGQKGTPQKQYRPGQRQQERLQRLARRRRRRQIWTASITAAVVLIIGGIGFWQYQRYTTQVNADNAAHATATAAAHAVATATAVTQNCFVAPAGSATDNIYAAKTTPTAGPTTAPLITGKVITTSDGLKYVDIVTGTGTAAKKTSQVSVQYTGWIAAGCKKFASSYDPNGQPFSLKLGQGQVIKGWDEGLVGMQPGGTRRLSIPASLAYGDQGQQDQQGQQIIPPGATLIFDVTMLSAK